MWVIVSGGGGHQAGGGLLVRAGASESPDPPSCACPMAYSVQPWPWGPKSRWHSLVLTPPLLDPPCLPEGRYTLVSLTRHTVRDWPVIDVLSLPILIAPQVGTAPTNARDALGETGVRPTVSYSCVRRSFGS